MMKNDIEALRGFANQIISYTDSGVIKDYARAFGLFDKDDNKTELLTGSKGRIEDAQRRLYWAWMTDMSKTKVEAMGGRSKDEWHWEMKWKYLVPIFIRDDSEFCYMHAVFAKCYYSNLDIKSREIIKEKFLGDLSITDATKEQAQEYLNDIEMFCHANGIMLRTDSQLYRVAMER
jgi:hypothetical protein